MCGILGHLKKTESIDKEKFISMLETISHRGQDDYGITSINTLNNKDSESCNFFLGHRRLSILDLSKNGHQPMFTEDKNYCIVFNGEIFNFNIIRSDLESRGYKFNSKSDTEVVLKAYQCFGIECIKMFRGFFAFCIYDFISQRLFIARDRIGSKPLRYFFNGKEFIFGSESQAIINSGRVDTKINKDAISKFLSIRYIPSEATIYQDVKKLDAGNYLVFDLRNFKILIKRYWNPVFHNKQNLTYELTKEKTKEALKEAIELRMVSDVPIGVFLSGGVDSTLITCLMSELINPKEINTYSVTFDDKKFDESFYSDLVAQKIGTNHHSIKADINIQDDFEKIVTAFDEPFADPSIIPTFYLAREVGKNLKVVLSGDGADEIFGGYKRYGIHLRNSFLDVLPKPNKSNLFRVLTNSNLEFNKKRFSYKFYDLIESIMGNLAENYYMRFGGFSKLHVSKLMHDEKYILQNIWPQSIIDFLNQNKIKSNFEKLLYIDQLTHLPEYILAKSDICGMANGLEIRAPFVDHKFIEWSNSIPEDYKFKKHGKRILKDILKEYGFGKDFIFRKKAGFNPPLKNWLKELDHLLRYYCLSENTSLNFLNREYLRKLYGYTIRSGYSNSNQMFSLLVLGVWLKNNKL